MDPYSLVQKVAQQNNEWSAQQAQKQMDFQERMSNTAHQREVADLKAAGLNPVLSAQQNGASTPAGAAATSDNSNVSAIVQLLTEFGGAIANASAKGGSSGAASARDQSDGHSAKELTFKENRLDDARVHKQDFTDKAVDKVIDIGAPILFRMLPTSVKAGFGSQKNFIKATKNAVNESKSVQVKQDKAAFDLNRQIARAVVTTAKKVKENIRADYRL